MFDKIVFVVVLERLRCRVDAQKRVLRPSPRADPPFFERDVPIVIGADTVLEVVFHQGPHVATISPVVGAISALLLGLVKLKIRVASMDTGNSPLACPLESRALDVVARLRI